MKSRPAETAAGLAGAVAILIAYFLDLDDPGIISALFVVVAAVPGIVTWCVEMFRKSPPRKPTTHARRGS